MNSPQTVVLYARLSQADEEPSDGLTATQRQLQDCRERAQRDGWQVLAAYEDPDHGASDLSRKRPDFERMMSDLGNGHRADAILCYKLDRLLRHPKEAERLLDLADSRGIAIVSLNDPGIDLQTPTGRAMFRMTVTWAKLETETMSLRIRSKMKEIAKSGRPGGGIRAFGLNKDWTAIVPEEAALVREATERILSGESLSGIVLDWQRRGVRTPGTQTNPAGRSWEVSSLKRMLTSPRIVGDRQHHGVVVGSGRIPALLDRPTWERLHAVLAAPRGSRNTTVRRYYLTGLTYCGRCGSKLSALRDGQGQRRYACRAPRGCGRLAVQARLLEPFVAEQMVQVLDSPQFEAALDVQSNDAEAKARREPDLNQLRADEAALEELTADYYTARAISKPAMQSARAQLEERIEQARTRLAESSSDRALSRLAGMDLRAEWERHADDVLWRNQVARALIGRITVNPAPSRGLRFHPDRIAIEWRV
ncbi:MAG: recombinase family protein [Chloroflexota bacterium]